MQDDIIKLVVPMDNASALAGQMTSYIGHDLVEVGVCTAKLLVSSDIADLSLLGFDTGESIAMAGVEVGFLAEG
jgi:hypothetical protein